MNIRYASNQISPATGTAKVDALIAGGVLTREDLHAWERADMIRLTREYQATQRKRARESR